MAKRGTGRSRKDFVSSDNAEFFKVFLPHLCSDKLRIPPDFVKDFHRMIKERIMLKVGSGKVWQVDVVKTQNGVFLTKGWKSFVSDLHLNAGDFLVFKYDKCYSFMVKIFGTNGCKKDTLGANNIATRIKIEESEEEIQENQPLRKNARRTEFVDWL